MTNELCRGLSTLLTSLLSAAGQFWSPGPLSLAGEPCSPAQAEATWRTESEERVVSPLLNENHRFGLVGENLRLIAKIGLPRKLLGVVTKVAGKNLELEEYIET